MADANDNQFEPDRTLKIFSLPSGSLTYSSPSQLNTTGTPYLFDFSLSGSGTVTGQVMAYYNAATIIPVKYTRQAAPTAGGSTIWSDPNPDQDGIKLSPDGTLIAVSAGAASPTSTTNIYKNGVLVTAVSGFAIGWIDNNQLLINNYVYAPHTVTPTYSGASIYDATGALLSTPTLPELFAIQPVTSTSIYSPTLNTIFSLPSGSTLYNSGTPLTGPAAVAGSNVVFASGSRIVIDTH
jgi:hypothetical protein